MKQMGSGHLEKTQEQHDFAFSEEARSWLGRAANVEEEGYLLILIYQDS